MKYDRMTKQPGLPGTKCLPGKWTFSAKTTIASGKPGWLIILSVGKGRESLLYVWGWRGGVTVEVTLVCVDP